MAPRKASRETESSRAEPEAEPRPRSQLITDARAIRALAHPLRVALLEAVRRDGQITATRAA